MSVRERYTNERNRYYERFGVWPNRTLISPDVRLDAIAEGLASRCFGAGSFVDEDPATIKHITEAHLPEGTLIVFREE